MNIATTQQRYLVQRAEEYALLLHPPTASSRETAQVADVPAERIAKGVVVADESGYALVVIPASQRLRLDYLRGLLGRDLRLADESELGRLFSDCKPGAVPPLGPAYGIETLVEASLVDLDEVYLEAGDHEQLVHLSGEAFANLMSGARRGRFGCDTTLAEIDSGQ